MRVPAGEIEGLVISQMRRILTTPEMIVAIWKQLSSQTATNFKEADVRIILTTFQEVWNELFPLEQRRTASLLIERITVAPTCVDARLIVRGVSSLVYEL